MTMQSSGSQDNHAIRKEIESKLIVAADFRVTIDRARLKETASIISDLSVTYEVFLEAIFAATILGNIEIKYRFFSLKSKSKIELLLSLVGDVRELDSIESFFVSAKPMEAEVMELFGIKFLGNDFKLDLLPGQPAFFPGLLLEASRSQVFNFEHKELVLRKEYIRE